MAFTNETDIRISVVGLGYVGLPLAIEFARLFPVIGFDINQAKLDKYRKGIDVTNEVGGQALSETTAVFTADERDLRGCNFHVIAVPTPINSDKTPDLSPIIKATETVARNLIKGSIVVYESTVYPGTTEEICVPILERVSGLEYGIDFTVGYSPERINPGDKVHRLTTIVKVVSGSDQRTLETVASIYRSIITAGVHEAESIRIAEAAKVIENSQRDINIAFMNELSMVFNKMGIDTAAVLRAAGTKWNFLRFTPGLVGGHCIGVDPYYFIYRAEQLGYHSQIILAGRKINDDMGKYVAQNTVKQLILSGSSVKGSTVLILGITFKENCSDVRNTRVIDIITELSSYGVIVVVYDPIADASEVRDEYALTIVDRNALGCFEAVVVAVAHDAFKAAFPLESLGQLYAAGRPMVLIDVKGLYDRSACIMKGFTYWSL